jgi:cytochrome c oxidase cbb3-type subunit IV
MDVNDLRSLFTVLSLATFVGIWAWAWSRRNQSAFDQAAHLPFTDTPFDMTSDAEAALAPASRSEVRGKE